MSAALKQECAVDIPRKLAFLLQPHRYKVVWGGRAGGKSWAFTHALLMMAASRKMRILCAREVQKSIKESVHATLKSRIEALGLSHLYEVLENEIRGRNGSQFIFSGLKEHTVESIKSYEAIDICWIEEAQTVSDESWRILIPTIRKPGSEVWISFNPDFETDAVWKRFMVNRPTDCIVEKMLFSDNRWLTRESEQERLDCLRDYPDDYGNIWLGECRTTVAGAIYSREVTAMIEERRYVPVPYDPRLPVATVWDIGWADSMSICLVQKPTPTVINVINYIEGNRRRYDEYVSDLKDLRYNYSTDWMPHDAEAGDPKSGKSAVRVMRELGRRVRVIPRTDPEARIRAARMLFPRCYIDSTERKSESGGYLGGARLLDCLRRYRRYIPKSTHEDSGPLHDQYSHGADCFGYLAEIADQIRNDREEKPARVEGYYNPQGSGMGMLG